MIDKKKVVAYESLGVSEEVEAFKKNITEGYPESEELLIKVIEGAFEIGFALGTHTARWGY